MSVEIKVPELPESIADAVIAGWYKKVGDAIEQDEVLVDLETDKVVLEVPALSAGVVTAINFQQGDTVTAGEVIAVIDETAVTGSAAREQVKVAPAVVSDVPAPTPDSLPEQATPAGAVETTKQSVSPAMSPSVRKLMAENSIGETELVGSGKNGRILKQDVEAVIQQRKAAAAKAEKIQKKTAPSAVAAVTGGESERMERRVPMTRLRSRIAERLVQAQRDAAILTTFNEVNMKPVMDIRQRYKEAFAKKYEVKLGFMSFFVQACVEALKRFPEINASIDGSDIVYHGYYDIGVAVSGPNGLVVPVVRDADLLSLAQVEQAIVDFGQRARSNALTLDDITGGTFTISNGGVFGSMLSTPILNPPQSAILGMHNIVQRPMVVDGEIVALPVMYLALSYDHRLIDGKSAVQFLVTVKQLLEDPSRLLLGL